MAEKTNNPHMEHIAQPNGGSASPDSLYFENPKLKEISHDENCRQPSQLAHQQTMETLREHGAPIDHIIPQANAKASGADLWWSKVRAYMQEPFSEFFGCFIMILFGDGVVAQVVLSKSEKGDYQSISWGMFLPSCPSLTQRKLTCPQGGGKLITSCQKLLSFTQLLVLTIHTV